MWPEAHGLRLSDQLSAHAEHWHGICRRTQFQDVAGLQKLKRLCCDTHSGELQRTSELDAAGLRLHARARTFCVMAPAAPVRSEPAQDGVCHYCRKRQIEQS